MIFQSYRGGWKSSSLGSQAHSSWRVPSSPFLYIIARDAHTPTHTAWSDQSQTCKSHSCVEGRKHPCSEVSNQKQGAGLLVQCCVGL